MIGKRTRKLLLVLGGVVGLLLVLVLALPLWFPWLVQSLSASHGLHYSQYIRKSYTRFELVDATFTNRTTVVTAKRLEGYVPTAWLWQLYVSKSTQPFATVDGWKVQIGPSANKAGERQKPSVLEQYRQTRHTVAQVNRWLPQAVLRNGVVETRGEVVEIPQATLQELKLSGEVALPKQKQRAEVLADLSSEKNSTVQLHSLSLPLQARALITDQGNGLSVQSTNVWLQNEIVASAQFGREGLVPEKGQLESKSFSIPARLAGLEGYQNVEGNLSAHWVTNQFEVEVVAHAGPTNGAQLPPVEVNLSATGNTESATVQQFKIVTPWLEANLSAGTSIQYTSPFLTEQTTLQLALNLEQQRWFAAKGKLRGQIEFRPGQGPLPESSLSLNGTGIELQDLLALTRASDTNKNHQAQAAKPLQLKGTAVQAELVWPELRITQAKAETQDGSSLSLQGIADLNSRMIHYGRLAYQGGYLREWLPAGFTYTQASLTSNLEGPWTNVTHSGQVQIKGLQMPLVPVLDVSGTWKGEQLRLDPVQLTVHAGKSLLNLNGAVDLAQEAKSLRLAGLSMTRAGAPQLTSLKPFEIRWLQSTGTNTNPAAFEITPLHLAGPAGSFDFAGGISWPFEGHITSKMQQLNLSVLEDFVPWFTNRAQVRRLELTGNWSNGPALFDMTFSGEARLRKDIDLVWDGRWRGETDGLHVDALSISNANVPVAHLNGVLPVMLRPGNTNGWLETQPQAPLSLAANVSPNVLLDYLKTTGVRLQKPEMRAALEGTLEQPRGRIEFSSEKVFVSRTNQNLPPLENVQLTAILDRQRARIDGLTFEVARQPVVFHGEVPLDREFWSGMPTKAHLPDWKTAKAELKIAHAQLAALGPYLPKVLSPEGEIDGTLALVPGGELAGVITVSKARTYPIASIGSVRDILVRLRFQERKALLESTAEVGGNPMPVTGTVDLSGDQWLMGELPPFELKVLAAKAPLSRTPDLILKADLNVAVSYDGKAPVTISGNVHLRDGYYLRDLSDFTSGRVSTPSRRPPYFSIEQEPLADWRLKLSVTGEKFLKVRSPLFNGEVSTALRLQGTLREPLALGELRVNSGEIRFPFATLPITHGLVVLTSENPYRPQLAVSAAARTFGYDIKMDLSGFADKPVFQFSSTPGLSSEQILLMVSAGELPRGELTFSTTQKAQRLALFVGKDLLSELGFSGDASRLTIRSGEDISETGRPTYSVEYKLEKDWSVIGEYDRFNDFNMMLKWRVYSH